MTRPLPPRRALAWVERKLVSKVGGHEHRDFGEWVLSRGDEGGRTIQSLLIELSAEAPAALRLPTGRDLELMAAICLLAPQPIGSEWVRLWRDLVREDEVALERPGHGPASEPFELVVAWGCGWRRPVELAHIGDLDRPPENPLAQIWQKSRWVLVEMIKRSLSYVIGDLERAVLGLREVVEPNRREKTRLLRTTELLDKQSTRLEEAITEQAVIVAEQLIRGACHCRNDSAPAADDLADDKDAHPRPCWRRTHALSRWLPGGPQFLHMFIREAVAGTPRAPAGKADRPRLRLQRDAFQVSMSYGWVHEEFGVEAADVLFWRCDCGMAFEPPGRCPRCGAKPSARILLKWLVLPSRYREVPVRKCMNPKRCVEDLDGTRRANYFDPALSTCPNCGFRASSRPSHPLALATQEAEASLDGMADYEEGTPRLARRTPTASAPWDSEEGQGSAEDQALARRELAARGSRVARRVRLDRLRAEMEDGGISGEAADRALGGKLLTALRKDPDQLVVEVLVDLYRDSSEWVRAKLVDGLIKILGDSPEGVVRLHAVEALAIIAAPRTLEALEAVGREDEDDSVRRVAQEAAVRIRKRGET